MKLAMFASVPSDPTDAAAYWIIRLEAPGCGPADRAAFEAWRAEKPEHGEAYAIAQQALGQIDRHLLDPRIIQLGEEVYQSTRTTRRFWRRNVAAGLAVICLMSTWMTMSWQSVSLIGSQETAVAQTMHHSAATYETRVGERSTFSLSDESTITLNTNSEVRVYYTDSSKVRRLKLMRGQAMFEVAKEGRPFEVYAGDRRVVALGTAFDVKLAAYQEEVHVTLVEGLVDVEAVVEDLERLDVKGSAVIETIKPTRLEPGQQLIAKPKERPIVVNADMDRATSWQHGRLVFRGDSLAQAVAEINRYSERKIVIANQSGLKNIRVSGVFATGSTRSFLEAMEAVHPVKAKQISYDRVELGLKPAG